MVFRGFIPQQREPFDAIFVEVGSGGLIAGISAYIKTQWPQMRIVGVEPHDTLTLHAPLAAGERASTARSETSRSWSASLSSAAQSAERTVDSARRSPAKRLPWNTSPRLTRNRSSEPGFFKWPSGFRMLTERYFRKRDATRLGHASDRVRDMAVRSSPPRSFTSTSSSQLKIPCSFTKRGSMVNTSPGVMIVAS